MREIFGFVVLSAIVSSVVLASESFPVSSKPKLQIGILVTPINGIGGETTGTAFVTPSGQIELILSAELKTKLVRFSGSPIGVVGEEKILYGPETGARKALDVRKVVLWNDREVMRGKLLHESISDVPAKPHFSILMDGKNFDLVMSSELQVVALSAALLRRDVLLSGIRHPKQGRLFFVDKIEVNDEAAPVRASK